MPALVIANVQKNQLPPDWAELLADESATYRVTIEPVDDARDDSAALSLALAMRGMEDEEGPEYTLGDLKETWPK